MSIKFYRVLFPESLLLLSLFIDNEDCDDADDYGGGSGKKDADLKRMGDCKEEIKNENKLWMVVFILCVGEKEQQEET